MSTCFFPWQKLQDHHLDRMSAVWDIPEASPVWNPNLGLWWWNRRKKAEHFGSGRSLDFLVVGQYMLNHLTTTTGWWFGTWMDYFSIYWEFHNPKWRTPSFFRGVGIPPTRTYLTDVWWSSHTPLTRHPYSVWEVYGNNSSINQGVPVKFHMYFPQK